MTVIELLQGQPPHFNQLPMQVMMLIAKTDPPTLKEPKKYSSDCVHFLKEILIKNHKKRPGAKEILKHKWMKSAPPCAEAMKIFASSVLNYIETHGGLESAVKQAHSQPVNLQNSRPAF